MKSRDIIRAALTRPVAFNPVLARIAGGSVTAGLFLSQAIYWTERTQDQDGWFWKTAADWEHETCLTRHEQDGARAKLKELGLLQSEVKCAPGTNRPVVHFRVDMDRLVAALGTFAEKRQMQMTKSGKSNYRNPAAGNAAIQQKQLPESAKPYKEAETTTETTTRIIGNGTGPLPVLLSEAPRSSPALDSTGKTLRPKPQDPRFAEICDAIRKCWPKGEAFHCDITPADAAAISRALAKFHDWTAEDLGVCIVARFQSASVNPTESIKAWMGSITDYQSGPQDKFKKPLYDGRAFDQWRKQASVILSGKQPAQPKLTDDAPAKSPEQCVREFIARVGGEQSESGRQLFTGLREALKKQINTHSFNTWIVPLRFLCVAGDCLYVACPMPEFRHVSEKFGDAIRAWMPEQLATLKLVAPEDMGLESGDAA